MAGVQQVEHAIGEDDASSRLADAGRQAFDILDRVQARGTTRAHSPDIRMPPENDQRWGGRNMPTSLSRDVTRNV